MSNLIKDIYTPNFLAAVFFGLFTLVFNLVAKYFLFIFNAGNLLPIATSSLLALGLGIIFGWLYGNYLANTQRLLKVFGIGVLFALSIIPFYSLGLQLIYYFHNPSTYIHVSQWQDYFVLYGIIILFFFLILGIWLIPLAGFAAILFNRRFYPGFSIYMNTIKNKNAKL